MKKIFVAAAAAALFAGSAVAMADSAGGNGPQGTTGTTGKTAQTKAPKMQHHPRYTTGANIKDPGATSNLPGKDGLTSKAWIENK